MIYYQWFARLNSNETIVGMSSVAQRHGGVSVHLMNTIVVSLSILEALEFSPELVPAFHSQSQISRDFFPLCSRGLRANRRRRSRNICLLNAITSTGRQSPRTRWSSNTTIMLSLLSLVSLLGLLTRLSSATALTYKLVPNERECFYSYVDKQDAKIAFYFAVQSGGSFDGEFSPTNIGLEMVQHTDVGE
jgi:hypothetical protein